MKRGSATFTAHHINLLTVIWAFLPPPQSNTNILMCDGPIYTTHKECEQTIVMHIELATFKVISLFLLGMGYCWAL